MFDNVPQRRPAASSEDRRRPEEPEDARIALRCSRRELEAIDTFVRDEEFESRSELMRAALYAFLRSRAASTLPAPAVDSDGYLEAAVRLKPHELARYEAFAQSVGNGTPVPDILAMILRRGEAELKVEEMVARSRTSVREAVAQQDRVAALRESGKDLERRGVVGR